MASSEFLPPLQGEGRGGDGEISCSPHVPIPHLASPLKGEERVIEITDLTSLRDALRIFCAERDWHQYHTPKNLVMALSVEAAELVEHFQWATPAESANLSDEKRAAVADEIADVLVYLTELADVLDIDMIAAARQKIIKNAQKYPAPINGKNP